MLVSSFTSCDMISLTAFEGSRLVPTAGMKDRTIQLAVIWVLHRDYGKLPIPHTCTCQALPLGSPADRAPTRRLYLCNASRLT